MSFPLSAFFRKHNLALAELEECRAEFLIKRDELLAKRLYEDSLKLAVRRREDCAMQKEFDHQCWIIKQANGAKHES